MGNKVFVMPLFGLRMKRRKIGSKPKVETVPATISLTLVLPDYGHMVSSGTDYEYSQNSREMYSNSYYLFIFLKWYSRVIQLFFMLLVYIATYQRV